MSCDEASKRIPPVVVDGTEKREKLLHNMKISADVKLYKGHLIKGAIKIYPHYPGRLQQPEETPKSRRTATSFLSTSRRETETVPRCYTWTN